MEENKDKEALGLKPLLIAYLLHWKLILGTGAFAVLLAILYLVLYPKTYETMARVQIQDGTNPLAAPGAGVALGEAAGLMKSFGLGGLATGSIVIDDEISTFTSNSLLSRMIYELGIYVDYCTPFSFGYRMYEDKPLLVTCDSAAIARLDDTIEFSVSVSAGAVKIKAEIESESFKETFQYPSLPALVRLKEGDFTFDCTAAGRMLSHFKVNVKVKPLTDVSEDLVKDFIVEELSKTSNIIEFTTTDYKKQRSKDMFNTLIRLYNQQETAYRRNLAEKSLTFLNDRIDQFLHELSDVEKALEDYKTKHGITHVDLDVQYYAEYMKELQVKMIEAEQQTHLIKMLDTFVKDTTNRYKLAPALFSQATSPGGVETDVSPLMTYNTALLERERIIKNSGADNPMVATLNVQIDKLRDNVYEMIDNVYQSTRLFVEDLKERERKMRSRMDEVPGQERIYIDYRRQQEILQGVYLLLLQKREEILLTIGQPTDKARLVDAAFTKPRPVAPRKLFAAIGIVLFTLFVTVGWLFCKKETVEFVKEFRKARR